jgi:Uma2 family endonuclease
MNEMLLELRQLRIQPGQQILLDRVSWQQFESILAELGERRAARVSYSNGLLEIMVPLPEHEKAKEIIGDIVKLVNNCVRQSRSIGSSQAIKELRNWIKENV